MGSPRQSASEGGRVAGMVSILMVNYNDLKWLNGSLQSVRDRITVPHETIIVDNNSSDGGPDFLATNFPEVKVIRKTENLGFILATNVAAQYARGEFLFLLNPDTILQSDLAPAVRLLQEDASVGVVGASMYGGGGELLTRGAAFPSVPRLLLNRSFFWRPFRGPYGPAKFGAQRVDWVGGSWLLTRASAWEKVGGLDEHLYMYCDEMHYCGSLKEIGLTTVIIPSLTYIHFRGFSVRRLANQYAGLRWFHVKFSGKFRRFFADAVMKSGLWVRNAAYSTLALLFPKRNFRVRQQAVRKVLDCWERLTERRAQFD